MYKPFKQPQQVYNFFNVLLKKNNEVLRTVRPYISFINCPSEVKSFANLQNRNLNFSKVQHGVVILRQKSKSSRKKVSTQYEEEDSDDEDEEDEDEFSDDGSIVRTYSAPSLRIDFLLKLVLNQKRKKIEEIFYNNKIRVNGNVLFKKSKSASVDDEIDIIHGISKNNYDLIEVSRIVILSVKVDKESDEVDPKLRVKVKKYKHLVIENYPEGDKWKEPEVEAEA